MDNSIAILGLEKLKQDKITERNKAVRIAAEPFNIEIESIDYSIKQLKEADKQLQEAREDFADIKEIKQRGGRRGKRVDHTTIQYEVYPFEEGVVPKFRYILKEADRILTIAEVADRVKQYEPKEDLHLLKIRYGKHVKKFEAQGYIKSYDTREGKKYGLPEWGNKEKLTITQLMESMNVAGNDIKELGLKLKDLTKNG